MATKLHRVSHAEKQGLVDLIFVHGIGGNPRSTWTDDSNSYGWLNWLDEDRADLNVYTIEYESAPSEWLGGQSMPIYDRANNLLELLASNSIGDRPIVFVGHSLGGLLIKKLLQNAEGLGVSRWKSIFENTRSVVFIASPHQGSARVPSLDIFRKLFRITELGIELEANNAALRDTYNWYRAKSLPTLSFSERLPLPVLGLIVDAASSEPGVPNAVAVPLNENHTSISKPRDRGELIYTSVLQFLGKPAAAAPSPVVQNSEPSGLAKISTLSDLISTFDKDFLFRWEQNTFNSSIKNYSVYWPVRLRRPTPIHAAQCFAAAGLQKLGASVHLFIDDLGEKDFDVNRFRDQLLAWLKKVGAEPQAVKVYTFGQVIATAHGEASPRADPWTAVRKWLGDTEYKLGPILKVSKLIKPNDKAIDLAVLSNKRPRRLLSPPMVWTCLSYLNSLSADQQIITLAGYDEKLLWDVWKDQTVQPLPNVGHLFLPLLSEVDSQHGSAALHMEEPKSYSLDWTSRDDIRNALQTEFNGPDWAQFGRLIPWSIRCCVFLPQFVAGQEACLQVAIEKIGLDTSIDGLAAGQLAGPLTNELAKWLI
ncbi:esterase/lipase family protein [Bradyrhizobium embrapense]|uniref:esterase/lipase family protein n=1 Tax=Bradyrhizobium embrapense TaxID=630921 RepID=UPI00067E2166|nr:alpha/beta fold hydrolase [Bradyrhizobium embrapense]